nr:MAG TPA: hypothetical protein [Caudoviricetes sp.]
MSSVYFGNATKQTWIKAPRTGMTGSSANWSAQGVLLSGKAYVKRSTASHRRFDMSWLGPKNDSDSEKALQTIKNFADGVYGPGPFFWVDPFAIDQNLFSPAWATSFLSVNSDWETIFSDSSVMNKTTVTTASLSGTIGNNTYDYPLFTAQFSNTTTALIQSNSFTFYIPDGYTLWLGAHGSTTASGGVFAKPYNAAGVAGTVVPLTMLGVNTSTRVNTSISSATAKKVEVYLAKTTTSTCTINLTGLIAQLLPTGTSLTTGNFIAGSGTTGLEFASVPTMEYYSSNINNGQIGMSVTFVEV